MPSYSVAILAVAVATGAGVAIGYSLARPASQMNSAPEAPPATVEHIKGSDIGRITLTARAAERLDIRTEKIREERVNRWRVLRGEVVAMAPPVPGAALSVVDGAPPPAAGADALQIRVHRDIDIENIGRDQLERVVIEVRDDDHDDDDEPILAGSPGLMAELIDDGDAISEDASVTAGTPTRVAAGKAPSVEWLHYMVKEPEKLKMRPPPGQSVLVKVSLGGPEAPPPKVVPYAALVYDTNGDTWVFTNPEPLVFVRQKVSVDFIAGDLAVLLDGPPVGTQVVTVGAAELLGAEFEIGH